MDCSLELTSTWSELKGVRTSLQDGLHKFEENTLVNCLNCDPRHTTSNHLLQSLMGLGRTLALLLLDLPLVELKLLAFQNVSIRTATLTRSR